MKLKQFAKVFFAILVFGFLFTGCPKDPVEVSRKPVSEKITKKEITNKSSVLKVTTNPNATVLASRTVADPARTIMRSARAGDADDDFSLNATDTLLAFLEDGTVESYLEPETTIDENSEYEITYVETVEITYDDGSTEQVPGETKTQKVTFKELQKMIEPEPADEGAETPVEVTFAADVETLEEEIANTEEIVLPAVRETYQCPYDKVEDEAKGIYIVYETFTDAAKMSAVSYVAPDGTVYDALKKDDVYQNVPALHIKSNNDEPYIQFDKDGNFYCLTYSPTGKVVYKYNPVSHTTDVITITDIDKFEINNFVVDEDGDNIFLNVFEEFVGEPEWVGIPAVYAIALKGSKKGTPVLLYKGKVKSHNVSNIIYWNKAIYFVVDDHMNDRRESAVYIAKADRNNDYSIENVTAELNMAEWVLRDFMYKTYNTTTQDFDYTAIKNFIFDFCDPSVEKELRLDKMFEQWSEAKGKYDWFYGDCYTELKDEDALKFLFKRAGVYNFIKKMNDNTFDWDVDPYDADGNSIIGIRFFQNLWGHQNSRVPLEKMVFKKGTDETAYKTSPAYYNSDIASHEIYGGTLIANDEGVFLLFQEYENKEEGGKWVTVPAYSTVWHIVDSDEHYVLSKPLSLESVKLANSQREDWSWIEDTDVDKWYKKPMQANRDGLFVYNQDKTSIWYYHNGNAENLLAFDSSIENIDEIVSFSVSDSSVYYNAKSGDKYFTKKVDVATKSSVQIKYDDVLGQMMEITGKKVTSEEKAADTVITVTIPEMEDLILTTEESASKVTITVSNLVDAEGYRFTDFYWTCFGKKLSDANSVDIPKTWARGSYRILLQAKKNGMPYSATITVTIE